MNKVLSQLDERALLLEPRELLDSAIVGTFLNAEDGKIAVYDYDMLVSAFAEDMEGETPEEKESAAIEWIEYNTIRALPDAGEWSPMILGMPDLDE